MALTARQFRAWKASGAPPKALLALDGATDRPEAPAPVAPRGVGGRGRRWRDDEARLAAVLSTCGLVDIQHVSQAGIDPRALFVRGYAWGVHLNPPRGFAFDAAVPARRLAFEVDGGAHAAGRGKVKADTERRGLAGASGWVVVAVTPEQVRDGSARALVVASLDRSAAS